MVVKEEDLAKVKDRKSSDGLRDHQGFAYKGVDQGGLDILKDTLVRKCREIVVESQSKSIECTA